MQDLNILDLISECCTDFHLHCQFSRPDNRPSGSKCEELTALCVVFCYYLFMGRNPNRPYKNSPECMNRCKKVENFTKTVPSYPDMKADWSFKHLFSHKSSPLKGHDAAILLHTFQPPSDKASLVFDTYLITSFHCYLSHNSVHSTRWIVYSASLSGCLEGYVKVGSDYWRPHLRNVWVLGMVSISFGKVTPSLVDL